MQGSKFICIALLLVISVTCEEKKEEFKQKYRVRRDGGLTATILEAAISAGASLVDTTVGALQSSKHRIAVSGSIENYSKWPLSFRGCEIKDGHMNVPLRTVGPSQREGFASHKIARAALGTWVKCSFSVDNKVLLHMMYNSPYSLSRYSNTLAFAVCPSNDHTCIGLDAKKMYYENNQYIARRKYYDNIYTLKKCALGMCISGVMGTNHKPEMHLKVMPESYDDLCSVAKDSSLKDRWSKSDYEKFIQAH